MSLDVYLTVGEPQKVQAGSGIYIRENGQTVQISAEEWARRFPDREPVVVHQADDYESAEVYSANITHNLNKMADEAGLYEALWHPAELDAERKARIREQTKAGNYHGEGGAYEIEAEVVIHARDLIQPLRDGLAALQTEPERFQKHNPENGWGSYDGLVSFVAAYLAACERWPDAEVRVSR